MAQPHPSQLFKSTKRPCWYCSTRHESDTIPALCSDPCREAWQMLYQLQYSEPCAITPPTEPSFTDELGTRHSATLTKHTNHGCNPGPINSGDDPGVHLPDFSGFGTTVAEAFAGVPGMTAALNAAADVEQQVGRIGTALRLRSRISWWRRWLRRG